MPKIKPQDLDEDNEVSEELRNPTLIRPKPFRPGISVTREEQKQTKINRREERLKKQQHWENTDV